MIFTTNHENCLFSDQGMLEQDSSLELTNRNECLLIPSWYTRRPDVVRWMDAGDRMEERMSGKNVVDI
jgi:hypothetical protein